MTIAKNLVQTLEQKLSGFRCWADDNAACGAADEAAAALANLKASITLNSKIDSSIKRANRAIKMLVEYGE